MAPFRKLLSLISYRLYRIRHGMPWSLQAVPSAGAEPLP
ncbi:hypothetical protein OGCDGJMD_02387 [Cyanobium usitatum str. Tous]|nr:hypothetical protein OGCDGJMD_02387 [Cyanobium usitatum str. Tous]